MAVATEPTVEMEFEWELEFHEPYLQVIDREANRVVTVVEILSPANKVDGSIGRRSYDEKRLEVLRARTNLVEIDLLRSGIPLMVRSAVEGRPEYMAQTYRFQGPRNRRRALWGMPLRKPLAKIRVPVLPEDRDAVLDLQQMLNIAYDRAGYDLRVDYRKTPEPPLPQADAEWARSLLSNVA